MFKSSICLLVSIVLLIVCACSPSEAELRAKFAAELTATAEAVPVEEKPRTIQPAPTDTPRPTHTPTPAPALGEFTNPAQVGDKVDVVVKVGAATFRASYELLQVAEDAEAETIARSESGYEPLVAGQKRIAAYLRIEVQEVLGPDEVSQLIPALDVSLRRDPNSPDVWATNFLTEWAEGYEPLRGEGWVVFTVRDDMEYFLYTCPLQFAFQEMGGVQGGAYFKLTE